jgi:hypothetical protein
VDLYRSGELLAEVRALTHHFSTRKAGLHLRMHYIILKNSLLEPTGRLEKSADNFMLSFINSMQLFARLPIRN